jgi:ABC-type sulfate transport system permease subunit
MTRLFRRETTAKALPRMNVQPRHLFFLLVGLDDAISLRIAGVDFALLWGKVTTLAKE